MIKPFRLAGFAAAVVLLAACQTAQDEGAGVDASTETTTNTTTNADAGTAAETTTNTGANTSTGASTGTGTSIPALVNVNLQNVLNDLSVRLKIDKANIPVNAQIPVQVAANVCGVSVNVLSVSTGGQASCTAKTTSPELIQTVQQQIAAGGNVGGGPQTTTTPTTNNIM